MAREYPRLNTKAYTLPFDERLRLYREERAASSGQRIVMPKAENETDTVAKAMRKGFSVAPCQRCSGSAVLNPTTTDAICVRCGHRQVHAFPSPSVERKGLGSKGNPTYRLRCHSCGAVFDASRRDARFCSPRCRKRASRRRDKTADVTRTAAA